MKKVILFLIVGLLLVFGGSLYFFKNRLKDGGYVPSVLTPVLTSSYNFDYSDKEKPWENHVKTDINTTFENVINGSGYPTVLKCEGDSADVGKEPYSSINSTCLQGNGAKMLVPILGEKVSYYIFNSPQKGGVFEQEHNASGVPRHFFDNKSRRGTMYFVVPFNKYEVPTYYPIESKYYLPIWKQVFQKSNSVDDKYFNSHIFVVGASVDSLKVDGKFEKRFSVTYYYQVDWARIKLTDSFTYNIKGLGESITSGELLHDVNSLPNQTKFKSIVNFAKLKPINHIVSRGKIKSSVKKASPLLRFDVNRNIGLDSNGRLVISLFGWVDDAANKCISSSILLEDATMLEVKDVPCALY